MLLKKFSAILAAGAIAVSVLSGCGSNEPAAATPTPAGQTPGQSTAAPVETVDIEVWYTNLGFQPIEKGSPLYEFYKEVLGVGVIHPYVEWNGGTTYLNQLNMKIAANEMPDLFLPQQGIQDDLARNNAIADLTDLLPEKAPNVWNAIPQNVWDIVKANDPTGEGRIYYIPGVVDYGRLGGLIRQDWLDTLELEMPVTLDDYVAVLEAFRDGDPNQNNQRDELPTGGREEARWMDHLYAFFGVAMHEGHPDWDIYDGELTYSAVTPNMRAALEFIADLYDRNLLDQESLLNNKARWDGKIDSNLVGNYFHWAEGVNERLEAIDLNTGVRGDYSVLPIPEVDGFEGFYTAKQIQNPVWVVKNNEGAKLDATLELLNNLYDQDNWADLFLGLEGMHHEVVNSQPALLPEDKSTMENKLFQPYNDVATIDFKKYLFETTASEDRMWAVEQNIRNLDDNQNYVKTIAGDGLPVSIYEGYADIQNRSLFVEYATKIIIGDYSIDKFDEFVTRWHSTGGEEVTARAREWYDRVTN